MLSTLSKAPGIKGGEEGMESNATACSGMQSGVALISRRVRYDRSLPGIASNNLQETGQVT